MNINVGMAEARTRDPQNRMDKRTIKIGKLTPICIRFLFVPLVFLQWRRYSFFQLLFIFAKLPAHPHEFIRRFATK